MRLLPLLMMLGLVAAELWYWQHSVKVQHQSVERDFNRRVDHAVALFQERFQFYQNILYATRGLYNSSEAVDAQEWHDFIRSMRIQRNYPGVRSVIFAEYREMEGGRTLPQRLHGESLAALADLPASQRGFAVIVRHYEPNEQVSRMPGYDLATEVATLKALTESCRSEDAVMGSVLIEPQEGKRLVRQVMPVFRSDSRRENEAQRHAALLGWVGVSYDVERWFDHFVSEFGAGQFSLAVAAEGQEPFFDSHQEGAGPRLAVRRELDLGDQRWQLDFASTPRFEAGRYSSSVHLFPLTALLLTLL
ncbi:MAG: CHASE domain-containing protein, partial [Pseudomonadota bacterium]